MSKDNGMACTNCGARSDDQPWEDGLCGNCAVLPTNGEGA